MRRYSWRGGGDSIHILRQGLDQLGGNGTGVRPHREETDAVAGGGWLGPGEATAGEVRDDGANRHPTLSGQSAGRGQHVIVEGESGSHGTKLTHQACSVNGGDRLR